MVMSTASTEVAVIPSRGLRLNNSAKCQAIARRASAEGDAVPHLTLVDVARVADAAGQTGRHRDRDKLMVQVLFDGCLRISECLGLRPADLKQDGAGWSLSVMGKGHRPGRVAISASLADKLRSYFYERIKPQERIFPVTRSRSFQIVQRAMTTAGIQKPDGVGTCHVMRHSGAIQRLAVTGNPKAVQDQLRHSTVAMTMRYLKTLSAKESLRIQQNVDMQW